MMRKIRSRHGQLALNFPDYQTFGMSREQESKDPEPLFAADGGEHVGKAGVRSGALPVPYFLIMEIWKPVKAIDEVTIVWNDQDIAPRYVCNVGCSRVTHLNRNRDRRVKGTNRWCNRDIMDTGTGKGIGS